MSGAEVTAPAPLPAARGGSWGHLAAYLALIVCGVALVWAVCDSGGGLVAPPPPPDAKPVTQAPGAGGGKVDVIRHVAATLVAVIALGAVLGRAVRAVGQPPVIGEVFAGILLGPSLLGSISPEAMHWLIPAPEADPGGRVLAALGAVAQLGVILYMFLVGLELDAAKLAGKAGAALAVSHASIVAPFVLGAVLALGLYPAYSHSGVPFTSFALFLGAAMAVTAFPVLARILADRNLDKTPLGVMALSCAAADDVTAWCLLALVVGVARAEPGSALTVALGAAAFVAAMVLLARPLLNRAMRELDSRDGPLPSWAVSATFLAVLASALATEVIGVHAVFGAFVLGAILPHDGRLARDFAAKLRDPVTVLLLPAFFAVTGLRTRVGLMDSATDWLWLVAVILVATAGKFGGTYAAARLTGHGWRDSAALGAMMNTRGLMGLIVLDVGLELGVIGPKLFAILVLTCLATTAMTAPALSWLGRRGGP